MSLAEFFGKIKKGEYDKRPIEQILADLNEAMKKSKYDKTLLEEIDELIRYLDGHLDAKHGLVSQLTAVASGLESTQPSAFHERLAEIMKELNGLRQELAAYVKEEDRRQERIHASIHGKAREGIDKIRETFSTFVRVMNENKRFFSKLRLPQSLSSKEIMDKIAQLESSIIAAESHSGKLEEKVAEFEHKLEREHEVLSEMLIRIYNLTSKSAAKRVMAAESAGRNASRRVKARESTGDLRIFLAEKSDEFRGIIEDQRNSIREIEDVVGGNMLNVFDEIYKLIVGIYYELARILDWSQEQRRERMIEMSRVLRPIYYPAHVARILYKDGGMLRDFFSLADSLDKGENERFLEMKGHVTQRENTESDERQRKLQYIDIAVDILNNKKIGEHSFLCSEITRLENQYVTTAYTHTYIERGDLRRHYAIFLGMQSVASDRFEIRSFTYFQAISVYFFLTYEANAKFFTTPGNMLPDNIKIAGRLYVNYLKLALKFYCQDSEAEEIQQEIELAKAA